MQNKARLRKVITPEEKRIIERKMFLKNEIVMLSLLCSYTSKQHSSSVVRAGTVSTGTRGWLQSICVTVNKDDFVHSMACVFICTLESTKTHIHIFIDQNIGSTWKAQDLGRQQCTWPVTDKELLSKRHLCPACAQMLACIRVRNCL